MTGNDLIQVIQALKAEENVVTIKQNGKEPNLFGIEVNDKEIVLWVEG